MYDFQTKGNFTKPNIKENIVEDYSLQEFRKFSLENLFSYEIFS